MKHHEFETLMIIIPSLNPDGKLMQVVDGMIEAGFRHVLVVNDGSDPHRLAPFDEARLRPECTVLAHEQNLGKGAALKTAFRYITDHRPDIEGVVTVDGDAQHTPKDAANLGRTLLEDMETVVLGVRDFSSPAVPLKNRLGNTLTSRVFRMLCGIVLSDTQTGLRAIAARYLKDFIELEGERFEYETNMLLYMRDAGIPFREVSIETVYIEDNATSHFNPLLDSARIYGPILRFAGGSLAAAAIDVALFTLVAGWLANLQSIDQQILWATVSARAVSSLFNYTFNRRAVFQSDEPRRITLIRYYALCVVQMLLSYKGTSWIVQFARLTGLHKTAAKMVVDGILFFVTFQIQRDWVFQKKKTQRFSDHGAAE